MIFDCVVIHENTLFSFKRIEANDKEEAMRLVEIPKQYRQHAQVAVVPVRQVK